MEEHSSKSNVMRYISVPSLESMALVRIVVQLWMKPEIKREIAQYVKKNFSRDKDISSEEDESFHSLLEKISDKLSHLFLPESLKREAAAIIKPIGLEIVKWIDFNAENYSYYTIEKYINYDCWTMHGTIDKAKTVEIYTDDLERAYCAACTYCSEYRIKTLWEEMPQEAQKSSFFERDMYGSYRYHLVAYWTCFVKKDLTKLFSLLRPRHIYNSRDSIYKNMFVLSLWRGNVVAVKYFWHKLTYLEICSNIMQWTEKLMQYKKTERCMYQETDECTDILCFLLSQMDEEQQRKVFCLYSEVILKALFLNWPWQKYLIPTLSVMWNFLQGDVYVDLLERFVCEIKRCKNTVNFLKQLWYNTPMKFKKCFIAHIGHSTHGTDVLWNLLKTEDLDAIKLILNDANDEEKKNIISSTLKRAELSKLILEDKLSSLEMLIGETLSSECQITDFKKNVMNEHGDELCHFWIRHNNWYALEKFIAWSPVSQEDIRKFKEEKINKIEIFTSLVCAGNYELLTRFMNWCFSSHEEINHFKKNFAFGDVNRCANIVVDLSSHKDWTFFPKFVNFCLTSDEEINQFKELFTNSVMEDLMFDIIAHVCNFEFASKFLMWRFSSSKKEIDKFKGELMVSTCGRNMFNKYVSDCEVYDSGCSNWELVKKLTKWFYPFTKEIVKEFKEYFEEDYFRHNDAAADTNRLKAFFDLLDSLDGKANVGTKTADSDCSRNDDENGGYNEVVIIMREIITAVEDSTSSSFGLS